MDRAPRPRAFLQVLDRPIDGRPLDPALVVGVAEEKAMIGDGVDESRNTSGEFRQPVDGRVGEQRHVPRASDPQPVPEILTDLGRRQRRELAAQRDPLAELPQFGKGEPRPELRLPDQQDLQDLARRRLEVREQSDLLQRRGVEVLCLIENEDRIVAGPLALDEEVVERDESTRPRRRAVGDPQVRLGAFEDAVERQGGIEDERDRGLSVEPLPKGVQQRRLSRADPARQENEAPPGDRGTCREIWDPESD